MYTGQDREQRADRTEKSGTGCDRSSTVSDVAPNSNRLTYCDGCQRSFSRLQDEARRSCGSVRSRCAAGKVIVLESCSNCQRTFRRPQDMSKHKCFRTGRL